MPGPLLTWNYCLVLVPARHGHQHTIWRSWGSRFRLRCSCPDLVSSGEHLYRSNWLGRQGIRLGNLWSLLLLRIRLLCRNFGRFFSPLRAKLIKYDITISDRPLRKFCSGQGKFILFLAWLAWLSTEVKLNLRELRSLTKSFFYVTNSVPSLRQIIVSF